MLYKKKILPYIQNEKFRFADMNVLLNAYEFWRYERKSKQSFDYMQKNNEDTNASISLNVSLIKRSITLPKMPT